jgi:hypothetical protein
MRSGPSIAYDATTGKASATRGVGQVATELIATYNGQIDSLALLGQPDVITHLLKGDNAEQHPLPVQNVLKGIRELIEHHDTQAKVNTEAAVAEAITKLRQEMEGEVEALRKQINDDSKAHQTAMTTQQTELGDEHAARLKEQQVVHTSELEAVTRQATEALAEKDKQIAAAQAITDQYRRLGTYKFDVYETIRRHVRDFGIFPGDTPRLTGTTLGEKVQIGALDITFLVRPDDKELHDRIVINTAFGSKHPQLVPISLELRTDLSRPGLTPEGRQQLVFAMLAFSPPRYTFMAEHYTSEELANVYQDPKAAAKYFGDLAEQKALTKAIESLGSTSVGLISLKDYLGDDDGSDATTGQPKTSFAAYVYSPVGCGHRHTNHDSAEGADAVGDSILDTPAGANHVDPTAKKE